jgi:hypothetical protein
MNPKASCEYYTLLMQDNSANKLQCASLFKFESHYPPLCGIIRLTLQSSLRSFSASLIKLEFHNNSQQEQLYPPQTDTALGHKKRGQSLGLAALCDRLVSMT